MALEPSLWGTLPEELLHLVFARLPLVGIGQLRILSKEWKRNVDCKGSEFNQVFDAIAHLNMFTFLSWKHFGVTLFTADIYDLQANQWQVYESDVEKLEGMSDLYHAVDGGLLCYALDSWWCDNKPGIFIVMNPLSKQKTQLPPLLNIGRNKLHMVNLTVDRKTKEYKVFVVASKIPCNPRGQHSFAQIYDSHIKKWTVVEATEGLIFGLEYSTIDLLFSRMSRRLCAYNCADRTFKHFNETNTVPGLKVEWDCLELIEDHLFILHKEETPSQATNLLEDGASMLQKYCISEFYLPEKTTAWVKLRVHSCGPCNKYFRNTPHDMINLNLWGYNQFLLVLDSNSGASFESAWLYNLSTCEWRNLPPFARPFLKPSYINRLFEISWSAIP